MNRNNSVSKRMKAGLAAALGLITLALGLVTPDPTPSAGSNALIAAFSLFLLMALATILALIPAPRDPRQRLLRRLRWTREEPDEEMPTPKYTGYGHPIFTRPLPEPDKRQREQ